MHLLARSVRPSEIAQVMLPMASTARPTVAFVRPVVSLVHTPLPSLSRSLILPVWCRPGALMSGLLALDEL